MDARASPWIHLADEVRAIRWLIEREDASGPFNLAAPETLTNAEFGRVLGRVMHRPSFMPTPGFALRLALGELSTLLLDGQRQVPQRLLDHGFTFRFPHRRGGPPRPPRLTPRVDPAYAPSPTIGEGAGR